LRRLTQGNFIVYFVTGAVFFLSAHVYSYAFNARINPTAYEVNDVNFIFKKTESINKSIIFDAMFLPKIKQFHREDLENDRERVKKLYFDNGFFDAIIDTATHFDDADNTVNIDIIII
jgi:hypothetical protein